MILTRYYTPLATWGRLTVGAVPPLAEDWECWTIERPWLDNRPRESCIPEGRYELRMRPSPVVHRSSGGEFAEGWEVVGVPGRSLIMLHPGNWASDLEGCIAPGRELLVLDGKLAVSASRATFRELMQRMQTAEPVLEVRGYRP